MRLECVCVWLIGVFVCVYVYEKLNVNESQEAVSAYAFFVAER